MSPLFKARMGGFCWLMCFLTSIYPLMLVGRFMVKGDPSATAANLLANETLFRSGTAALLISTAFYIGATLFIYELLTLWLLIKGVNVQGWNEQART